MAKKPFEEIDEAEAKRRFEKAVGAALHTPPMHRPPKPKAKSAPKKAKTKR